MSSANRPNRKVTDDQITRLNSLGLSLGYIARRFSVHATTISLRLKQLGVDPADTRRTFMEEVYTSLSPAQQEWLADQLGPHVPIKDYVKNLLVKEYMARVP